MKEHTQLKGQFPTTRSMDHIHPTTLLPSARHKTIVILSIICIGCVLFDTLPQVLRQDASYSPPTPIPEDPFDASDATIDTDSTEDIPFEPSDLLLGVALTGGTEEGSTASPDSTSSKVLEVSSPDSTKLSADQAEQNDGAKDGSTLSTDEASCSASKDTPTDSMIKKRATGPSAWPSTIIFFICQLCHKISAFYPKC